MVSHSLSTHFAQNEHDVFRAPEHDNELYELLKAYEKHIRHVANSGAWPADIVMSDEPPGGWVVGAQEKVPAREGPRRWLIDYNRDHRWQFVSDTECGYDLPERELHLIQLGDEGEWIVRISEKTVQPWSNFARVSRFRDPVDLGHGQRLSYDQAREIGKLWMDGTEPEALGLPYEPRPEYPMRSFYEQQVMPQTRRRGMRAG